MTDVPNNPSATLLDFGSGPSILEAICGSRRIPNIVCADLLDANQQEIIKWLNKDADAFDWSSYIQYISGKEGIE